MYFNHENKFRDEFKTGCFEQVMWLLNQDEFKECKNFIASKISCLEDNLVYIPGQDSVISLEVDFTEQDGKLCLEKLSHNGKTVFKRQFPIYMTDFAFMEHCRISEFKEYIANKIAAPNHHVSLIENGTFLEKNSYDSIYIPGEPVFNHYTDKENTACLL